MDTIRKPIIFWFKSPRKNKNGGFGIGSLKKNKNNFKRQEKIKGSPAQAGFPLVNYVNTAGINIYIYFIIII